MWLWFVLLLVAALVVAALVATLLWRARGRALAQRTDEDGDAPATGDTSLLPLLVRDLHPSFKHALERLRKAVRGVDFRYGVPWYLLVGPAGAGKTTLVAEARHAALHESDAAAAASSVTWHYFDGGVVIDVDGALALPASRAHVGGWRALLHLLKRHRPRRPIDGVVLAVPASLLLDEGWKSRAVDVGAAIRERLVLAQSDLGFALPVYLVITHGDLLRGFSAFAEALPDNLRQDMIGWSNPHSTDTVFQGAWIDKSFEDLHRVIVRVQVELFASSRHLDHASELFLFSGELWRLRSPLRALLEEIFRPSVYQAASLFRGFYLSGLTPTHAAIADADRLSAASTDVCFLRDVLDRKVFPERGLAAPLTGATVARNRVSTVAQVAAAVLFVTLATGTLLAISNLRRARVETDAFLNEVDTVLDLRIKDRRKERNTSEDERIAQGYHLLQGVVRLSAANPHSIFLPISMMAPLEETVAEVLRQTFGKLILTDFRVGLEEKGRDLFDWNKNPLADADAEDELARPVLERSPHYRALQEFAQQYRLFVDNYFRYVTLARDDAGDINDLVELGSYLTGHTNMGRVQVPDLPYGQALREASAGPVDCAPFRGLVEQRARRLLTGFGSAWFGDENPVRVSANNFTDQWALLTESRDASLRDLVGGMKTLTQAVSTWAAIGGRSGELRLPVLEQAPFKMLESPELCLELKPDLVDAINRVGGMRTGLTSSLVTIAAEPFGPLLERDDKGLKLGERLQMLKMALDDLSGQDFWAALPRAEEAVLPAHPTWRPEAIDHTTALFDSFDRYRGAAFADFESAFRRQLVADLSADVARSLSTKLSFDATQGEPLPSESTALMAEVSRLDVLLSKLGKLVPFFEAGHAPFARELITALGAEASDALQRLEREAAVHHPYVFARQSDFLVSAWADAQSGSPTPAEGLKRWGGFVDEQRDSLRRYAAQADPLVRFLTTARVAPALTRRWAGIVEDVANYDQKLAGNGLGTLDGFLREVVPVLVPERDCGAGGAVATARSAGFLGTVRNELLEDTLKRCRDLARSSLQSRYAAVARSFNQLLAGRFPFSQNVDGTREAAAADVGEFLRLYDRQDGRSLLQQIQGRSCGDDAALFLSRLDALYPVLSPARELQTLALDLLPEFRVNRDREVGANQIAQWQLDVGRQAYRDGEAAKAGRWVSGDPVRLALRFAKDSPSRPIGAAGRGRPAADRSAQFDYQGGWALFALLAAGRPAPADLAGVRDAAPNILAFDIPVERDAAQPPLGTTPVLSPLFRVYIRVRVFQPGKTDPLTIGEFPARAPADLSCPAR